MEEKMKSLFEYLKEIYELKTRVVLDYKKFDSEYCRATCKGHGAKRPH